MEESDSKLKGQLSSAESFFSTGDYVSSKKILADIKIVHPSIDLNLLLIECKEFPQKISAILNKILDVLSNSTSSKELRQKSTQSITNTKDKKNTKKTPKINNQFSYWNIIVLSQLTAKSEIAELIATEAVNFLGAMRTETSLMMLYTLLKIMENSNRLASCISLIEKQNNLLERVKKSGKREQAFRFLNQIVFNKVLLKLGMIEGSMDMYMMRFNQNEQETKDELQLSGVPIIVYQQLLRAEIEYHSKNYPQSVKILADLMVKSEGLKKRDLIRSIVDHNLAIILANLSQTNPSHLLFKRSLTAFTSSKDKFGSNEPGDLLNRCRQNMLLASMMNHNANNGAIYEWVLSLSNLNSYKMNYRKAQVCLNYYHELLQNPSRISTYCDTHDFYETVYYYPNLPYFQQKGKNKNLNYTNGKYYFRRYVLPSSQDIFYQSKPEQYFNNDLKEDQSLNKLADKEKQQKEIKKQKGKQKTKKVEQPIKQMPPKGAATQDKQSDYQKKLKEVLQFGQLFLKQALVFLQKQRNVIVNLEGQQKGLTAQVNQKLFSQYVEYKSSIYAQLCYIYLCKHQWIKVVSSAEEYHIFQKIYQLQSKNPSQQKIYYNILTYRMEALCQLNRIINAYEVMHNTISIIDYSDTPVTARSTTNEQPGLAYFESISQYNIFYYNIAVLHSRDNKIAETFQSIQKILQQMRLSPTNPQANIPLFLIELLIHYNLRTNNNNSALQMIKRRRILNLPGVIGHYQPILSVTK